MRASRLLSIQMLSETRGRMGARALADALEVSVRTLYRDGDELGATGMTVISERGRTGGLALLRGWKTTLTGLTPSEAQAVFVSGLAGPAADLGLRNHVEQAQLKRMAALPAAWRDDARRASSRLYLDPMDWHREAETMPHLRLIASAVWGDRTLALRYQRWARASRQLVHPLGRVLKAGAWYLVAARDDRARTCRVSNIFKAVVQDGRAVRPGKFDLAAHWRASVRQCDGEAFKGEATVLATPAGLKGLACLSSAVAKRVAQVQMTADPSQRAKIRIPIESIEHATGQLIRLAPGVEVLERRALRRSTIERVTRVAARGHVVASPSR